MNKLCTSLAIGFYLRDLKEFEKFKLKIQALSKMDDSFLSVFEKEMPFEQAIDHQERDDFNVIGEKAKKFEKLSECSDDGFEVIWKPLIKQDLYTFHRSELDLA